VEETVKLDIQFEVHDPIGKILNEHKVIGFSRPLYRIFARQLVTLAKKGKVTCRFRSLNKWTIKSKYEALIKCGFNVKKAIKKAKRSTKNLTIWFQAKDYAKLKNFYVTLYGLNGQILDDMLNEFNKEGKIHVII
jgi:hypothetical protein